MITFRESGDRRDFACAQVERVGGGAYLVTGQCGGEMYGRDGLGHVFVGPGARERATRTAIAIAYGKKLPELGASSGETLIGLQAVIVCRKAA